MKVIKIILILVLLFSFSFGVCSDSITNNRIDGGSIATADFPVTRTTKIRDRDITLYPQDSYYGEDTLELPPYWSQLKWKVCNKEPDTLLNWFKDLTLEEKVEIYNWWKYKSVNLVLDVGKYGDITIRVNKDVNLDGYKPCYVKMEGGYPSIITPEYIESDNEKEVELTIEEPEQIFLEFTTGGVLKDNFKPQLFLKVTDTDLSRCLIDGRLRISLNGEIYWLRLEKGGKN